MNDGEEMFFIDDQNQGSLLLTGNQVGRQGVIEEHGGNADDRGQGGPAVKFHLPFQQDEKARENGTGDGDDFPRPIPTFASDFGDQTELHLAEIVEGGNLFQRHDFVNEIHEITSCMIAAVPLGLITGPFSAGSFSIANGPFLFPPQSGFIQTALLRSRSGEYSYQNRVFIPEFGPGLNLSFQTIQNVAGQRGGQAGKHFFVNRARFLMTPCQDKRLIKLKRKILTFAQIQFFCLAAGKKKPDRGLTKQTVNASLFIIHEEKPRDQLGIKSLQAVADLFPIAAVSLEQNIGGRNEKAMDFYGGQGIAGMHPGPRQSEIEVSNAPGDIHKSSPIEESRSRAKARVPIQVLAAFALQDIQQFNAGG